MINYDDVYDYDDIKKYIISKGIKDYEDVFQNSIMKLFMLEKKGIDILNVKSYFFIIVKGEIYNYYKRKEKDIMLKSKLEQEQHDISHDDYDFLNYENYEIIPLILKGYKQKEISAFLGVSLMTVHRRLKEEKERLKNELLFL